MDALYGKLDDKSRRLRPGEEATIMAIIEKIINECIENPEFLTYNHNSMRERKKAFESCFNLLSSLSHEAIEES